MLVAYDSMTGNVKRFIHKLNMPAVQIGEDLVIDEDFILITYTTGFGNVPERVLEFLERNNEKLKAYLQVAIVTGETCSVQVLTKFLLNMKCLLYQNLSYQEQITM